MIHICFDYLYLEVLYFMINFDRGNFEGMNTREKITFVNDLVIKNTKLEEEELKYLVPNNREKYFYNRARTSDWLEDYEFNQLSEREKEIYIDKKRFLGASELKRLSPELQKNYIKKAISSGVQLKSDEFESLDNEELRRYYAKEKIKYSTDTAFTAKELLYLDSDDQIHYINNINRLGFAPNPEEIKSFTPKALRYYKTNNSLNEIRSIIKEEIKKIL